MKKILKVLLMLLMCLSLVACDLNEKESPWQKYSSLEEINKLTGVNICKPEGMEITNETFITNDNQTAAYQFESNGYVYYVRGCRDLTNDMSGIFVNNKPAFAGVTEKVAFVEAEGYKVYRFILGNKQYVFGVNDEEKLSKDTFSEQFTNYRNQMIRKNTIQEIKDLLGEYQDSYSQRASAELILGDDINQIIVNVKWSNSSTESEEFVCICKYDMGKLIYDEISHTSTNTEDNNSTTELNDYSSGYLSIKENKLYWDGSGNDLTKTCVFEKIN